MRTKLVTVLILSALIVFSSLNAQDIRTEKNAGRSSYCTDEAAIMPFVSDNTFYFFGNETLQAYSASGEISVTILDINGRRVMDYTYSGSSADIHLGALKTGVYFAVMNNSPNNKCKITIIR